MSASGTIISYEGRTHFGWAWGRNGHTDTLVADELRLILSSRLGLINLRPGTVLRVERAPFLPCLCRGIVIHHRRHGVPSPVGFIPSGVSSKVVLEQLLECGYTAFT
jgi:hypothetical protein